MEPVSPLPDPTAQPAEGSGCALTHQNPMARLFFWVGTTGGLGIIILLAATRSR